MRKPVKKSVRKTPPKPKRPSDPNLAAHAILAEHLSRVQDAPAAPLSFQAQYKAHMSKLGAKGGRISGARRMENLSERQRKGIAKMAAAARWAGHKRKGTAN